MVYAISSFILQYLWTNMFLNPFMDLRVSPISLFIILFLIRLSIMVSSLSGIPSCKSVFIIAHMSKTLSIQDSSFFIFHLLQGLNLRIF